MKKKLFFPDKCLSGLKKLLLVMKLTTFLVFLSAITIAANSYSQNSRINLRVESKNIVQVFDEIELLTDYGFLFKTDQLDVNKKYTLNLQDASIDEVMNQLLDKEQYSYKFIDRTIVISKIEGGLQSKQEIKLSGKVTDVSGAPLPGVTVVVKGTTNGTITDFNGIYTLSKVPSDGIIQFSFVGMKMQEVSVAGKSMINVVMVDDAIGIEEVVAVGYGTQKKRDVIGSIASVKSDVIEAASSVSNFASLLQGQAAGASVQTSSGRLGASVNIKVRGLSSISAGTSPLWIVDGVPIITSANTGSTYTSEQSPMSLINQADVESIEILKDAAATSIYGSRGSNGVIIITTKSGSKGKMSVNLDYNTGVSGLPSQKVEFINTKQWFQMKDEMKEAYGLGKYSMTDFYDGDVYITEPLTREQAEANEVDWFKEGMRKGSFQSYNLSVVGGSDKSRYFMSANYRKDKGVMLNDDLERYGLRINLDMEPSEFFKTGAKFNFSLSNSSRGKNYRSADNGNKTGSAGGFSFINSETTPFNPVYSLANPNEYFNPYLGNVVATSDPDYLVQDVEMYRGLANIYGEFIMPFWKDLAIRTELSIDFIQANRNTWISEAIRWDGSLAQDAASTSRTFNYNAYLKYNKIIGDHSFDAVGGIEAQRSVGWLRQMEGEDLVGSYKQLGTPSQFNSMYSGLQGEAYLFAYFGRANYKFKDKYLAGVSVRRDASAVFTPEYRWGTFVALSAGWILTEESFLADFGKKNFLKLRGSFGQTGNANIPSGLDVSKYSSGKYYGSQDIIATNGTMVSSIGVSNLTWETTNNLDVGLDFGFNNNRINGSLAYYNKYVKDLLLATKLPYSSGIGSIYGNIGDLVNSGVEFNISSINLDSKKLKWQTTFNISYNHNEVKKLVPRVDEAGTGMVAAPFITKVGYPVRDYYMSGFAGVDTETGLSMIYALDKSHYTETGETRRLKDENGDDVLLVASNSNANANKFHMEDKSQTPVFYGGITNQFSYKGFDLSLLITFSGGNYIYDTFMRDIATALSYSNQILTDVYENYWKKPGDEAKYQRLNWKGNLITEDGTSIGLGDSRYDSDQFLYKGDYVKLKTVTIGYTVPKSTVTGRLFQNLRLYATVENLYTLTKYPGWDPEGQGNVNQWDLPQLLSATFGVSVKF